MLNIHGEILDLLNESEYYLFSILLNYGTKSCPDNGVLLHRTGWGLNKLQATKKSLTSKGILTIEARFNPTKGEKGRESNYYIITTDLASKFCDKVPQNKLLKNQLVNNKLLNNKLDDFGAYKEVLKSTIIETTKVLKENKGKVLIEKNYPPTFTAELIECFEQFLDMRKKIKKPLKLVQAKIDFLAKWVEKLGVEAVQASVQNSIDNEYQGIFPKALPKGSQKPPEKITYQLPPFQTAKQREYWFFQKWEFYKELGILENRLCNTVYRQQAYEKRDPEGLIAKLEKEFPKLLDHEFKNERWQTIQ